jgi:spermidine synthase
MLQHGILISEVLRCPGPTHSVVDVMSAVARCFSPGPKLAVLGFAGGGIMAPLRALGSRQPLDAVDLNAEAHEIFRRLCGAWCGEVRFHEAEVSRWLKSARDPYDMILEDLSIPRAGDVVKPEALWTTLPARIRRRLGPRGVVLFNLLKPDHLDWRETVWKVIKPFRSARLILLDDFENRLVLAGSELPSSRVMALALRRALRQLDSRQWRRFSVRTVAKPPARKRALNP